MSRMDWYDLLGWAFAVISIVGLVAIIVVAIVEVNA